MTIEYYIWLCQEWEGVRTKPMGRRTTDNASKYPCPTPFDGQYGWHTVKGITYGTWVGVFGKNQDQRFFAMSDEDWFFVFKTRFANPVKFDSFKSINVAAVVTDMSWMSGPDRGVKTLQRAINNLKGKKVLEDDGNIGNLTLAAANAIDPKTLIQAIVVERKKFLISIAIGKNAINKAGWLRRTDDYLKRFMTGIQ